MFSHSVYWLHISSRSTPSTTNEISESGMAWAFIFGQIGLWYNGADAHVADRWKIHIVLGNIGYLGAANAVVYRHPSDVVYHILAIAATESRVIAAVQHRGQLCQPVMGIARTVVEVLYRKTDQQPLLRPARTNMPAEKYRVVMYAEVVHRHIGRHCYSEHMWQRGIHQ